MKKDDLPRVRTNDPVLRERQHRAMAELTSQMLPHKALFEAWYGFRAYSNMLLNLYAGSKREKELLTHMQKSITAGEQRMKRHKAMYDDLEAQIIELQTALQDDY